MPEPAQFPFGASDDARTRDRPLADRFRRQANSLERSSRSPLCVQIMRSAAADINAGGVAAELFAGIDLPPGSVPALRLQAAMHFLVLSDRAPALAEFYPDVGGTRPPEDVWRVAQTTLREHFDWARERLGRTVQTNEPGRAAVLFSALLWLANRYRLPIRLLEIGASAGLNLLADRFRYDVGDERFGDPASPVRFADPWTPPPAIDLSSAARELRIDERAGCDVAPLDPSCPQDQLIALSYIWPDEPDRLDRARAALQLASRDPAPVAAVPAGVWLPEMLAAAREGQLTVVWHSLFRQYVGPDEWGVLEEAFRRVASRLRPAPVVWLSMEPGSDQIANVQLTIKTDPDEPARRLAWCGDHGPPVRWDNS